MPVHEKTWWLDFDLLPLPIAVPPGWQVRYHQLYDVHPDRPIRVGNCPGGDYTELFKATLLVIAHSDNGNLIDVGWMPEADLNGSFWISLYESDGPGEPLDEISTREPHEVVAFVERLMVGRMNGGSGPELAPRPSNGQ